MQLITMSRSAALMGILIIGAALAGCNDSTQSGSSGTSPTSSATADPAPASVTVLNPSAANGTGNGASSTSGTGNGASGTSSSGGTGSSSGTTGTGSGSSSSGAAATSNTATLSWLAPTENTNGTALTNLAGYNIYYGTSLSAMVNKISINTVGIQTYVISDLASGTWYFTVAAVNSAGVESSDATTVQVSL